jgi:hypothetical protein
MTNKWVVDVKEDPETGDLMLELPPDLLTAAGWATGDVLTWHDNQDGTWTLTKKEDNA